MAWTRAQAECGTVDRAFCQADSENESDDRDDKGLTADN